MPDAQDIALIYDDAVDPSLWQRVLERLIDRIGGSHGTMVREQSGGGGGGVIARMDPDVLHKYLSQCHISDPLKFSPGTPAGHFLTDRQIASRQELVTSRYHHEFLRPVGIHSLVTAILWRGAGFKCCVNLHRSPQAGEFDAHDVRLVRDLGPHLVRAMGVSLRLAEASIVSRGAEAALDRLSHGLILLDRRGKIGFLNREAEAILATRDGLAVTATGLAGARKIETERLTRAIAKAKAGEGSALRVERPSGRRPLVVLVAPFRLETEWLGTTPPMVIVTVTDPERTPVTSEARLIHLYGLTHAEAAIGVRLLGGLDLAEIARERHVSVRTARVHLGQIFAKTGTGRQAELVRMLISEGAGPL
jgi:DNA-binding CsgD family transcriptional regulator